MYSTKLWSFSTQWIKLQSRWSTVVHRLYHSRSPCLIHPAQISPALLEQIIRQVQEEKYRAKDPNCDVDSIQHLEDTEKTVDSMINYWNKKMVKWLKKILIFPKMRMTGYQVPRSGKLGVSLKVGSTQSNASTSTGSDSGASHRPSLSLPASGFESFEILRTLSNGEGGGSGGSGGGSGGGGGDKLKSSKTLRQLSSGEGRPRSASELAVMDTLPNLFGGNNGTILSNNIQSPLKLVRTASLRMRVEIIDVKVTVSCLCSSLSLIFYLSFPSTLTTPVTDVVASTSSSFFFFSLSLFLIAVDIRAA